MFAFFNLTPLRPRSEIEVFFVVGGGFLRICLPIDDRCCSIAQIAR